MIWPVIIIIIVVIVAFVVTTVIAYIKISTLETIVSAPPTCPAPCGPGQTCCAPDCVYLTSDNNHCGSCYSPCLETEICCGGVCTDPLTDVLNCGICGNSCAVGEICCDGKCVDPDTDLYNCSSCGNVCDEATEVCCGGSCVTADETNCSACGQGCEWFETCCSKKCVNVSTSFQNCGSCGNECDPGYVCCEGICVEQIADECGTCNNFCGGGETCCGGECVNVLTNEDHCGACGNQCDSVTEVCCGGVCISVKDDDSNCGSCGNVCVGGETCCNFTCVDTNSDYNNCGSCGTQCGPLEGCCSGLCIDITSDSNNCGSCGNVCSGGYSCVGGVCLLDAPINNLSAVLNPTATDDSSSNYTVGSHWVNVSSDMVFMCTDNTLNNAVWVELTNPFHILNNYSAVTDPTGNDDSADGYTVGSHWINTTTGTAYICVDNTLGSAVWYQVTVGGYPQLITVAKSGADFTTIKDALTFAATLSPTTNYRILIQVFPGEYAEETPLQMIPFVSIAGIEFATTVVKPDTGYEDQSIFIMCNDVSMSNFIIMGAHDSGGVGITVDYASGINPHLSSCQFQDCETCILIDATANPKEIEIINCDFYRLSGQVMNRAFDIRNGAKLAIRGGEISSKTTPITYGVILSGSTGTALFEASVLIVEDCDYGIYAGSVAADTIELELNNITIKDCTEGLHMQGFCEANLNAAYFEDCTNYDIYIEDSTCEFFGNGCSFLIEKFHFEDGTQINLNNNSKTEGDYRTNILGDLSVGNLHLPSKSNFGQGAPTAIEVLYFRALNGASFDDQTAVWASYSGSSISLFQGTASTNEVYFGTHHPFNALRVHLDATYRLGGTIVWEYSTGVSSWTTVETLNTSEQKVSNMWIQNANTAMTSTTGLNTIIRFGDVTTTTWTTRSINGSPSDYYWIRARITSALTTSPVVEQILLYGDTTRIDTDGSLQHFGDARTLRISPITPSGGGPTSTNTTIGTGPTMTIYGIDNTFINTGIDVSRSMFITVPVGFDTSLPSIFGVKWFATESGTLIGITVQYTILRDGVLNTDSSFIQTATLLSGSWTPAATDTTYSTYYSIPLYNALPGDMVALTFTRTTGDANNGSLTVHDYYWQVYRWLN